MFAPARAARGGSFERRSRFVSVAKMLAPGATAASASDLPPAPAQRSMIRSPSFASQASAISWLPSSCTSMRPEPKAG